MIDYVCCKCGARNCKLWREYMVTLDQVELHCAPCAGKKENRDVSGITPDGFIESRWGPTDQIGGMMPAALTAEGDTFWGYTSVPPDRVKWWRELPSLPQGAVT